MKKHCFHLFLILVVLAFLPGLSMAGSATLNWQPNTESDLGGYRVYYGTSSRTYGPPLNVNTTTTCTLSDLSEGAAYYFAVTAFDTAGNESGFSTEVQKAFNDGTNPVIALSTPTSGGSYATGTATLTVTGTATDNVGVTRVAWSNDRGGSGTASGTGSWTAGSIALSQGTNVLTFTAEDAAGNRGSRSLTVTYSAPDTSVPTVSLSTPTSGGSYATGTATLTVTGTATDNVGVTRVAWSSDRGGSGTASGTASWTAGSIALSQGTNVLTFTAEDAAGNRGSRSLTVTYSAPPTVEVDQVAPTVRIVSPTSKSTYFSRTRSVNLAGTAVDNIQVTKITWRNSRGETDTASGTLNWSVAGIPLNRYNNTITITAHDAAGNSSSAYLKVFCWR